MKKRVYRIEFDKPVGARDAAIRSYIVEALEAWGGQFRPEDPLFDGLRRGLRVTRDKKEET